MSWKNRQLGQTRMALLNTAFTLTSTPVTNGVCAPFANTVALLQSSKLTDWVSTGEVWRPLAVQVQATTSITVTAPVLTLQKAPFVGTTQVPASASAGGVATATLLTAKSAGYCPFTDYVTGAPTAALPNATKFVADAAGDCWSISVTTSPSAGAATLSLAYVLIDVAGVSDAITTL